MLKDMMSSSDGSSDSGANDLSTADDFECNWGSSDQNADGAHLDRIGIADSIEQRSRDELNCVETNHNLEREDGNPNDQHIHPIPSSRHVIFNSSDRLNDIYKVNYSTNHEENVSDYCVQEALSSPLPPHSSINLGAQRCVKVRPFEANDVEEQHVYKFLVESPIEKEIRVLMEREAELRREKGLSPVTADLKSQETYLRHGMIVDYSNLIKATNTNNDGSSMITDDGMVSDVDFGQSPDNNSNDSGKLLGEFTRKDGNAKSAGNEILFNNNYPGKGMMARFIASRGKVLPNLKPTLQRREQRLQRGLSVPSPSLTTPPPVRRSFVDKQHSAVQQFRSHIEEAISEKWEQADRDRKFVPLKRSQSAIETMILKELDDMKLREEELRVQRADSPISAATSTILNFSTLDNWPPMNLQDKDTTDNIEPLSGIINYLR